MVSERDKVNHGGKGTSTTFHKCDITLAAPLDDEWTYDNVARWTTYNAGIFCNVVDKDSTHVLATPEQYAARTRNIKKALKYGAHIVTKDWFDDSLAKKRRLNEKAYSLVEMEKKAKKAQKDVERAKNFVDPNLNHIYRDETNFTYAVTLTRNDEESGNIGQKYQLFLWESNSKPHLYRFAAKFFKKPRDHHPAIYRPSSAPGPLERELAEFAGFFREKTGSPWDERVGRAGVAHLGRFAYQPPASSGGKPGSTAATTSSSSPETDDGEGSRRAGSAKRVNRKRKRCAESGQKASRKRQCREKYDTRKAMASSSSSSSSLSFSPSSFSSSSSSAREPRKSSKHGGSRTADDSCAWEVSTNESLLTDEELEDESDYEYDFMEGLEAEDAADDDSVVSEEE